MALFRIDELRTLSRKVAGDVRKAEQAVLRESATFSRAKTYDIFLSHSFSDAEVIHGVSLALNAMGYRVYVDWLEDRELDRTRVTRATAELLRDRMGACRSLFFATTVAAAESKWMPWELGYFDGLKGKSAILPVSASASTTDSFVGQEYLGLYPYVTKALAQGGNVERLWIHTAADVYVVFEKWLEGVQPSEH